MKSLLKICILCTLIFAANAVTARAQYGSICENPSNKDCAGQYDGFEPQDLIFNTGRAELGEGTRHKSVEFYAVILESVRAEKPNGDCNFISETKRKAAQKLFPKNKVFASRIGCRGAMMFYPGADENHNFMAVYGGATEANAKAVLKIAKKKYPSANIRKLTAMLDFTDGQAVGDDG